MRFQPKAVSLFHFFALTIRLAFYSALALGFSGFSCKAGLQSGRYDGSPLRQRLICGAFARAAMLPMPLRLASRKSAGRSVGQSATEGGGGSG
jgi:hypothetical protein